MAYGYNDGDQRRQSVRLAGRTTPTPRSATSSNPQRPQEQPRPSSRQQTSRTRQSGRPSTGTSAQQDSRLGARTRQRQAEVPQLRRNGARQSGIHINRFFSHPQGGRDGKPYRSTSYVNAPVIAAVRPGTFTNVGHYIVLYGIDDADQIEVFDPNSASRSARRWGVVEVLNEVEAMWAYY